jgi:menaquinone-dependent protoporphyrinogen IX oxidase
VEDYQFVLVGSPVYGSKLRLEANNFIEANEAALKQVPVAFFGVCLAGISNDPKTLPQRLGVFDPWRRYVHPVDEVLFAGRVNRCSATLFLPDGLARLFPTLDFRDWNKIDGWAQIVFTG